MINETYKNCSGCGGCFAVCPVNAITMKPDSEGFLKPEINHNACIDCGRCDLVCSEAHATLQLTSYNDCVEYYGYSKCVNSVKKSASGGLAYELGIAAIEDGYKVFGVRYDEEKHGAVADIAETVDELDMFRGSKYVAADFSDAFKRVLNDRSKYLVIATPCLIQAMRRAVQLADRLDDFIFVDFVCHGTPSEALWHRYLEKYGALQDISQVSFRAIEAGWHNKAIALTACGRRIISPRKHDAYYKLFDSAAFFKRSCYSCAINNGFGLSDIRLGDAWGAEFSSNSDGVSRIIIASSKGQSLFDKLEGKIEYGIPKERIKMPERNRAVCFEKGRIGITADLGNLTPIDTLLRNFKRNLPIRVRITAMLPTPFLQLLKRMLGGKQHAE